MGNILPDVGTVSYTHLDVYKRQVLGDGCVVGAGAVVCGKFEDNCVIAGNPAKVIRRL